MLTFFRPSTKRISRLFLQPTFRTLALAEGNVPLGICWERVFSRLMDLSGNTREYVRHCIDQAPTNNWQAMIRPNFTKTQVSDLDALESHVQILFSKIPKDGSTIDMQTLISKFTLDYAMEFLFGESAHSLTSPEGSETALFGQAFDLAQSRLGQRIRLGKLVKFCRDTEFNESCKIVHKFADDIISRAMDRIQPKDIEKAIDTQKHPERYTFLNELLKSTQDPKQIRDELLNILLAGRDTTASLLGNTLHVLSQRPDIWKTLKAEVDALDGKKPNYETLRNMKYVKCLLNECKFYDPITHGGHC